MFYDEIAFCGFVSEFGVVVRAASGGILDSSLEVVEVYHFVQHGGDYVLDGTGERSCADVELVTEFSV